MTRRVCGRGEASVVVRMKSFPHFGCVKVGTRDSIFSAHKKRECFAALPNRPSNNVNAFFFLEQKYTCRSPFLSFLHQVLYRVQDGVYFFQIKSNQTKD